jgi:hypothetical protein
MIARAYSASLGYERPGLRFAAGFASAAALSARSADARVAMNLRAVPPMLTMEPQRVAVRCLGPAS